MKRFEQAARLCRDEPHTVIELAAALRCSYHKARTAVGRARMLGLLYVVGKLPSGHLVFGAGSTMEDRL